MESREPAQTLKQRHSSVTRRAILDGARQVFAERGFAGTSMKTLAEASGVAVQTIYSTFGSKAGVLAAMVDLVDEESGVHELAPRMRQETDPGAAIALFARLRRQIRERCGDIIQILRSGAAADPEVASVWHEGMRRRRIGLGFMMEQLGAHGALKAGLTPERAADIAAALVVDEVCDVLVDQRGWSFDDYESWLAAAMTTLILSGDESTDHKG
jgi:AcrR family transcriptional regulator